MIIEPLTGVCASQTSPMRLADAVERMDNLSEIVVIHCTRVSCSFISKCVQVVQFLIKVP